MSYGTAPLGTRPHGAVDAAAGPVSHDLAGNAQAVATTTGILYGVAALDGAAVAQAAASGNIAHGVNLATSPVIYARPASTIVDGGFLPSDGTSPLHTLIDEVTPDDSDYIYGSSPPASFNLAPLLDPGLHTGHVLAFRAWSTNGWIAAALERNSDGVSVVSKYFPGNGALTPTTYELALTEAEAEKILDYGDLRISLQGLLGTTYFSWAELRIEQGGAAKASASITHGVPLSAMASATATATGGLAVGKPLSAAVAAQASASATLATVGAVDLAAAVSAVASASGAVSHGVPLAAAAAAVASASATVSTVGSVDLAASATASATTTAALSHGVPLAASVSASASATGNTAVLKALYAAAAGNAQAMASLGIGVGLVGGAAASASASGAVSLDIWMHGPAWVQATGAGALSASPPLFAATPGYIVRQSPRAFTAQPEARAFTARPAARSGRAAA